MARTGLGWSAQELAERAGVGYATVARFETGATIRQDVAEKLEKVLADAGAQFTQRSGRIGVTVPEVGKQASSGDDQ